MSVNIGLLILIFGIIFTIIVLFLYMADSSDSEKLEDKKKEEPNALTEFRKRMGLD